MSRLRMVLSWSRSRVDDALVLTGLILIAYGLGSYSPPLGPIVVGLGLIAAVRLGQP